MKESMGRSKQQHKKNETVKTKIDNRDHSRLEQTHTTANSSK